MSDLVERLKKVESSSPLGPGDKRQTTNWFRNPDGPEAAAELARLAAEVARLREALTRLFNVSIASKFEPDPGQPGMVRDGMWDKAIDQARTALETTDDQG